MATQSPELRDVPLRLSWKCDLALLNKLGVRPESHQQEETLRGVVGALLQAAEIDRWLSYSRNHNTYCGLRRYYGPGFTRRSVVSAVEALDRVGLVEHQRALRGSRGRQSRLRALPVLIEQAEGRPCRYQLIEPLRLKDQSKRLIDYHDTERTVSLRRDLQAINNALADIDVALPDAPCTGNHYKLDKAVAFTPQPCLHRVFLRSSWDRGGRAVGWWQSVPALHRDQMLLNGEPVVRPDYSALHAQMLYAEARKPVVGDPYEVPGFSREQGKAGFQIAVNARNRRSAILALVKNEQMDWRRAAELYANVCRRNAAIERAFGTDAEVRLMRIDSDIILECLRMCIRAGIPALPVHDELIVPVRHGDRAVEIMIGAFESRVKPITPCRVKFDVTFLHNGDTERAASGRIAVDPFPETTSAP